MAHYNPDAAPFTVTDGDEGTGTGLHQDDARSDHDRSDEEGSNCDSQGIGGETFPDEIDQIQSTYPPTWSPTHWDAESTTSTRVLAAAAAAAAGEPIDSLHTNISTSIHASRPQHSPSTLELEMGYFDKQLCAAAELVATDHVWWSFLFSFENESVENAYQMWRTEWRAWGIVNCAVLLFIRTVYTFIFYHDDFSQNNQFVLMWMIPLVVLVGVVILNLYTNRQRTQMMVDRLTSGTYYFVIIVTASLMATMVFRVQPLLNKDEPPDFTFSVETASSVVMVVFVKATMDPPVYLCILWSAGQNLLITTSVHAEGSLWMFCTYRMIPTVFTTIMLEMQSRERFVLSLNVIQLKVQKSEFQAGHSAVRSGLIDVMTQSCLWLDNIKCSIMPALSDKSTAKAAAGEIDTAVDFLRSRISEGTELCKPFMQQEEMLKTGYHPHIEACEIEEVLQAECADVPNVGATILKGVPTWGYLDVTLLKMAISKALTNAALHGEEDGLIDVEVSLGASNLQKQLVFSITNRPGDDHDRYITLQADKGTRFLLLNQFSCCERHLWCGKSGDDGLMGIAGVVQVARLMCADVHLYYGPHSTILTLVVDIGQCSGPDE